MIDVKMTILETIKDKIKKLRFLGRADEKGFKKILSLIILDDMCEWSDYLDEPQAVQKKLLDMKEHYILCQRDFIIARLPHSLAYVNVNTPLTHYTWKRVWDAPDLVDADWSQIISTEEYHILPFTPDPSCKSDIVYYPNDKIKVNPANGAPLVDFNLLSNCDKMNIYINMTEGHKGEMWVADPAGGTGWIPVKATEIDWSLVTNRPTIYSGIEHHIGDDELVVSLLELDRPSSSIAVTDSNPNPDENQALNDIL